MLLNQVQTVRATESGASLNTRSNLIIRNWIPGQKASRKDFCCSALHPEPCQEEGASFVLLHPVTKHETPNLKEGSGSKRIPSQVFGLRLQRHAVSLKQ